MIFFNNQNRKIKVTHFSGIRGGKKIPLRKTMAEALSSNQCPTVKSIFVMKRTENLNDLQPNDIILDEAIESFNGECQPEAMNSEDPLFILYTSGSTGKTIWLKIHQTLALNFFQFF